jgi:hypothetical protein
MGDNIISLEAHRRNKLPGSKNDDDVVVCMVTVRVNGTVSVWLNDRVQTEEQWNWLHAHVATATGEFLKMEKELT